MKQASAEIEARRSQGGGQQSALWFRLGPGEETVIRFLEQDDDIKWCQAHEVPVEGRQWGRDVPCVDQDEHGAKQGDPCPGCETELPRRFKGYINVIWDDAPVFKRDGSGKLVKDTTGAPVVIGTKPQVAIWSSGIRLFEDLEEVNANYRGLMSRRFKVKRTGTGFDTKYRIAPEDVDSGPQPLSDEEKKLAEGKYDLKPFVTPGSYEDFEKELRGERPGQQRTDTGQNGDGQQPKQVNPFLRNKAAA